MSYYSRIILIKIATYYSQNYAGILGQAYLQNIDIFIGTESHLDNSIPNSEVFPNTYNTCRCDRNRDGGGVFILIWKSIPSFELYTTNSDSEIEWVIFIKR